MQIQAFWMDEEGVVNGVITSGTSISIRPGVFLPIYWSFCQFFRFWM